MTLTPAQRFQAAQQIVDLIQSAGATQTDHRAILAMAEAALHQEVNRATAQNS